MIFSAVFDRDPAYTHILNSLGILVALTLSFLTSKSNRPTWFKIYVVITNLLTAGQTVTHTMQAFECIDSIPPRAEVRSLYCAMLENLPATHIDDRSVVGIVDDSLVSAIMIGTFLLKALAHPPTGPALDIYFSNVVWSFSSLAFDAITTLSTIFYFYRIRKDLNANQGALFVVWQVLWASAAPPLILIFINIIDTYAVSGGGGLIGVIATAMMGKGNVSHLPEQSGLIRAIGKSWFYHSWSMLSDGRYFHRQSRIRQQFERRWATPTPGKSWMQKRPNQTGEATDWPTIHVTVHAETIELATIRNWRQVMPSMKSLSRATGGIYLTTMASLKCDKWKLAILCLINNY
ncbi:hypothetical protein RhiXN_07226 [Rhizoctonia solani]|uniref:Uncharacterized protein n=1 Tax=Rhizoctonia solani TaxID=456999 RepID=A0A8H8P848_9AGAM|nr:uncharacterized protein RhiXN_07226 [Rhizoctonia solani]QRW25277.1 hypothetical protein RhiXN_07226 [Rhizoctonia solani]